MHLNHRSFAGAHVLGTALAAALLCGTAWSQTTAAQQQDAQRGRDAKPPTAAATSSGQPPTGTPNPPRPQPPTGTPPTGTPNPDPKPPTTPPTTPPRDPKPPTANPDPKPPTTPPTGKPDPKPDPRPQPPGKDAVGGTAGVSGLAGTPGSVADLEVQPIYGSGAIAGAPGTGYCAPMGVAGQQREVTFRVHNKGAGPSGAFYIDVQFTKLVGATVKRHFTNLNAGASHVVNVPIPNAAWDSGAAHFYIHADPNNAVAESNNYNNHATSKCVQPSAS